MLRRYLPLALLAIGVGFVGGCGANESTKQDAARTAFDGLKSDNFEVFRGILPTAADLEWLAERLPKKREQFKRDGGTTRAAEKVTSTARVRFQSVRIETARRFDWAAAEFMGLDTSLMKSSKQDSVEVCDVYFMVRAGKEKYVFHLNDCIRTKRGWVTGRLGSWGRVLDNRSGGR